MLEYPLRHAYLIPGDPESCLPEIKAHIETLYESQSETLRIDPVVMDLLLIEDARELSRRGRQMAAGESLCLLRGFSRTNKEAQNALLKILEEPADGIHFFFVTPSPERLLETVRSRMERKELCSQKTESKSYVQPFLQADGLPDRLSVAEKVVKNDGLRSFVVELKEAIGEKGNKYHNLRQSLVSVGVWLDDVGRSDKQIVQLLAVAAQKDLDDL
jgi:hypothetical protein